MQVVRIPVSGRTATLDVDDAGELASTLAETRLSWPLPGRGQRRCIVFQTGGVANAQVCEPNTERHVAILRGDLFIMCRDDGGEYQDVPDAEELASTLDRAFAVQGGMVVGCDGDSYLLRKAD